MSNTLGVAVVGAGYWGPNLARNFQHSEHWRLEAICDLDLGRAQALASRVGSPRVTPSLDDVLADPAIDAIAVATPARTHYDIAMAAIAAGKNVLVEKPLADTAERGRAMVQAADAAGVTLMIDHTFCYTQAVLKTHDLIEAGELGEILYIDSVRINLGLVQPDVDVFWDLAPHDLSIMDFILPGGLAPLAVTATGADPLDTGRACVGYLSMNLPGGAVGHAHVNWLSPTKIRQFVVGGSRKTLVWDDLNPQQRISVYDRGVDLAAKTLEERTRVNVSYRIGDTWSPALKEREALTGMVEEFAAAIREGRRPRTDGDAGLRVLSVLEAARASLASGRAHVPELVGEPA
ncbi:oxidoreductase domain protein [Xylanimonas cellulosilytica DSM 15894]|uniref:Oxidoreductase domain protein n=1 Tax=Xylanimonas cellulosilytica (strain DSM 15894 / JCM 12276 / CECT 5975 / KCTC 9989 / LMG 20990 / NBRC 107835 / XIL07) TaxID=446471 RepID=D1BXS4_XYLCX|nr:Gfo/Idh/MocA family oxidoreductase [Xylanimonas cellulosilytica]ACZ31715.1 oxidoreductase domain protein [Xylanimonas cellulosilytica DSM 15894]